MNLKPVEPDARELVDRARILTGVMLENPDETGPNFVLLLILAEQLQRLRDIFEAAEVRRMQEDKLPL
ncbi:hypothetical protein I5375_21110 [Citrobacter freundii]|uniref:hypothetical protein n=1 Tax=Citrobacter portucalensis TaxID=1639133 RepID=UPI001900F0CF|nr:hypothetical protein [Citrobacter freundii]MBJ8869541.1 hypothetical protein [Citrobacter braakii]MBJ8900802.1 hypothetical protein [Citrobacter braakii]MBJ8905457.1 hypothetical protein [Citrobacter braakii]MBJ8922414.1 hypothetical protein [Citrobacter braakii]